MPTQLHEFMDRHRAEILDACARRLHETVSHDSGLERDVATFFDEVCGALQREFAHGAGRSPLPGKSETAARLGSQPQRAGVDPSKVPFIYGAISASIGEVGSRYEIDISAEQYKVFNECIDAGVATSIEQYWDQAKQEHQQAAASLGYVAHELRIAVGNASMAFKLMQTGDVAMKGRTAAVLRNNLARMEGLVARTLGEVQLDAGIKPTLRPIHVATMLGQLQTSFIPDRDISLAVQADDSAHVVADEMLLVSALSNLISNAIKFSRPGTTVTLRSFTESNGVVVEVEDACGGLNTDDPAKLFLPFVKGGESSKNTGLGLSITKRAVEVMGATVQVTNHPGKGCSFAVRFPHRSEP